MKKETENMEFTGERFVPEVHGNIELEHLHRYLQACEFANGKIVLDIASDEGYGSAMLAAKVISSQPQHGGILPSGVKKKHRCSVDENRGVFFVTNFIFIRGDIVDSNISGRR